MRKHPIIEIEDVQEPFCGSRRKDLVPLCDAEPDVAYEWCYELNAGWGPEHLSRGSGVRCWWECQFCLRTYKAQINSRTGNQTACPYCASKRVCSDNALSELFPAVATEWHPTKNGKVKPSDVTHASNKRAWWLCKTCKHEWNTAIVDRTFLHAGCPACYEARMQYAREHPRRTIKPQVVLNEKSKNVSRVWYENGRHAFTPLSKSYPKVAKQWHPTKNGDFTANDYASGSDAIAWWKCKKGPDHEWQAAIYSRTGKRNSGCPFCTNRFVSVTNSLKTLFPNIAKEWHPKRNGKLTPDDVTAGSTKKVWWQCRRFSDHEWETTIALRTTGSGCPCCSHYKVSALNCLSKDFPYIAAQLHPTKNGALKADKIAAQSGIKVWWMCPAGPDHEWQATPANRTYNGSNCPACAGRQVSVTNSLASLFPEIAKQWHKRKNGKLRPSDITSSSRIKVWWQCDKGHSWQQAVGKRTETKGTCYQCRTGKPRPGTLQ